MLQSPPSRRRGLKSYGFDDKQGEMASPPSRRRGLKYLFLFLPSYLRGRLLLGGVD